MRDYLRLLAYLRPFWPKVVLSWGISLLVLAMQSISIWLAAGFIHKILSGGNAQAITASAGDLNKLLNYLVAVFLDVQEPYTALVWATLALLFMRISTSALRYYKLYLFAHINQTVLVTIRGQLFHHLAHMDMLFSQKIRPGELTSIFINDVEQLNFALFDAVDRAFMQPIRLGLALVLMASVSLELTLWSMAFMVIGGVVIHLVGARIELLVKRVMEKTADLQGRLTEFLSAALLARMLNREQSESERFNRACQKLCKNKIQIMITDALAPESIAILYAAAAAALLLLGGRNLFLHKTITSDDLLKMFLLLPMAMYPLEALATLYTSVRASLASARRVFGLMNLTSANQVCSGQLEAPDFSAKLELSNLSYTVDNQDILKNLDTVIPSGAKVALCGHSGAGKTTLLRMIAGIIHPTQGSVSIDGVDLKQIKGESWRSQLGIVTQEPILLKGSVRENLLYAEPQASDEMLVSVLQKARLWVEQEALPQGLDTQIGNRGEVLSGGERQRLTIARSLLKNPRILLMDEPTSMLDAENKQSLMEAIEAAAMGRTLIMATHDQELISMADIKLYLDKGKLAAQPANGDAGGRG